MKMKTADFTATLRDIAARVEAGDSFEGSIRYTCMDEECGPDEFLIEGAYRIGNSEGQGGMRLLQAKPSLIAETAESSVVYCPECRFHRPRNHIHD